MSADGLKNKDFYSRLLLSHHASHAEIKKAYREIAKVYHPDTCLYGEGNHELSERHFEIFKLLTEAYHTLSNEDRRRAYDRLLRAHQIASYRRSSDRVIRKANQRYKRKRKKRKDSKQAKGNRHFSQSMTTVIRELIFGFGERVQPRL